MRLTYTKSEDRPALWIQCKGDNSGKPLQEYMINSFSVWTDDPDAYGKLFALWHSHKYHPLIRGSVVPFISINETRSLISEHFPLIERHCPKRVTSISQIEEAIKLKHKQIHCLKQMQYALAQSLMKPP